MNIQGWSPLRSTGLISLLFKGLSGVFSSTTVWRHQFFGILPSLWSSSHNHMWPLGRLDDMDLCQQNNVFAFQHTKFVIAFLSRSNHLLISWLQSQSAVILEPKRKSVTTSTFSLSICHVIMGPIAMILVFLIFSFKPALSLSSFTLIKRLMLKLKRQYFGHLMWTDDVGKVPDAGKDWGQKEKRASEDEMAGRHHWRNEHELVKLWGMVGDREACRVAICGVTKNQTWLGDWTTTTI